MYAPPSTLTEIVTDGFTTGLTGTIGYRIRDNQGADTTARTTAGIVEDIASSGIYRANITSPAAQGQYTIVWDAAGVYATEDLIVTSTTPGGALPSGNDLCTIADVKNSLEPAIASTTRDPLIQTLITAASDKIMDWCEREFAPVTASAARRFDVPLGQNPDGGWVADLSPYDLRTATTVTLHPESTSPVVVAATDYSLEPFSNADNVYYKIRLSPYLSMTSSFAIRFGYAQVSITGAWGFAAVPARVNRACVLAVRSWLRQNPAAYAFPDTNMVDGVQPEAPQTYTLPGGTLMLLDHYKRAAV